MHFDVAELGLNGLKGQPALLKNKNVKLLLLD